MKSLIEIDCLITCSGFRLFASFTFISQRLQISSTDRGKIHCCVGKWELCGEVGALLGSWSSVGKWELTRRSHSRHQSIHLRSFRRFDNALASHHHRLKYWRSFTRTRLLSSSAAWAWTWTWTWPWTWTSSWTRTAWTRTAWTRTFWQARQSPPRRCLLTLVSDREEQDDFHCQLEHSSRLCTCQSLCPVRCCTCSTTSCLFSC